MWPLGTSRSGEGLGEGAEASGLAPGPCTGLWWGWPGRGATRRARAGGRARGACGGQWASGKMGEFTEPDPGLPDPAAELEARMQALAPPPTPPCHVVAGVLQYPPQEGGEAGSWQLPAPPTASPTMPLTPVVCPNDRLASLAQGDQPGACECAWRRAGESQPGTATVAAGTVPAPPRQDTWLGAWSQPSPQPLAGVPRNMARQPCLPVQDPVHLAG